MTEPDVRRFYTGGCHCGAIRFLVKLHPSAVLPKALPAYAEKVARCNCTICHKTGYFHIQVPDHSDDFYLLSPTNPLESMGNYHTKNKNINFIFCNTCGIRCFIFAGEAEVIDMDLATLGVKDTTRGYDEQKPTQVWHVKAAKPDAAPSLKYLSINGNAIDAEQEGFDMREYRETEQVIYVDFLHAQGVPAISKEKPHSGGYY